MSSPIRPWPYAAKSVVQFEWLANVLTVWVIFRHPMNQSVKPPHAKWLLLVDGAPVNPTASVWIDAWTLKLTKDPIVAHPASVTLEYDGPDADLRTTWGKQWEPWGPIIAADVPYDFEHVLEIDIPNERVTINGVLVLATKILDAGTYNNLDVSDVNVLLLRPVGNPVVLTGFAGGVYGQVIQIARINATAHDATLVHGVPVATQKLLLHAMANETLNGEFGGWTLVCDSFAWFDVSHAKHV